jgi:hypothetical protein
METVLDALKAMGKATYRDVAARLDIEPVEALNMLREQKEQGLCDFYDGSWSVGTAKEQAKQQAVMPVHQAPRLKGEEPVPVDHDVIRQQLRNNGAMTTAALAAAVNRNARGMVSVMLAFERQGVVIKNGQGRVLHGHCLYISRQITIQTSFRQLRQQITSLNLFRTSRHSLPAPTI